MRKIFKQKGQKVVMRRLRIGLAGLWLAIISQTVVQAAPDFAAVEFQKTWQYSDLPVETGTPNLGRGYTWGPTSLGYKSEPYREAFENQRLVQYFDKARMELGGASNRGEGFGTVTNGLLTVELVTGRRQEGDETFVPESPSDIQVAGDDNNNGINPYAPTYATFKPFVEDIEPYSSRIGETVDDFLTKDGKLIPLAGEDLPARAVISAYDPTTHHNIAKVFYDFMYQRGPVTKGQGVYKDYVYTSQPLTFVFGLPITEPYWIKAEVAGLEKDVLVQLFERRVLTYTPSNPAAYRVEMGNIGIHYFQWRYGRDSLAGN